MRYRLAVFTLLALFVVQTVMDALAAPAPDPYAILDIGPPPEGKSADEHCKYWIGFFTDPREAAQAMWAPPKLMDKLLTVLRLRKDSCAWTAKNVRVTPEDGGRCLRLTFRAGNRTEQVLILNALLRAHQYCVDHRIKVYEDFLQLDEKTVADLEKRIETGLKEAQNVDPYRKGIDNFLTKRILARRAEISRHKQVAVIKWAK